MPVPAGSALVTLELRNTASTRSAFCVFGVDNPDAHTAEYIANNVRIDFDESLAIIMTDEWSLIATKVINYDGTEFTDNTIVPGGTAGSSESPQVAYLLKKGTGFAGREHRGRMYLPGVNDAWTSSAGVVLEPHRTDVSAAAEAFLGKLTADAISMQLFHTDPMDVPTEVLTFTCDSLVATQRRRLR